MTQSLEYICALKPYFTSLDWLFSIKDCKCQRIGTTIDTDYTCRLCLGQYSNAHRLQLTPINILVISLLTITRPFDAQLLHISLSLYRDNLELQDEQCLGIPNRCARFA